MSETISTVGVIDFKDRDGRQTGCIDVCRDESGRVYVRASRQGDESVLVVSASQARMIADLLREAANDEGGN